MPNGKLIFLLPHTHTHTYERESRASLIRIYSYLFNLKISLFDFCLFQTIFFFISISNKYLFGFCFLIKRFFLHLAGIAISNSIYSGMSFNLYAIKISKLLGETNKNQIGTGNTENPFRWRPARGPNPLNWIICANSLFCIPQTQRTCVKFAFIFIFWASAKKN